MIHCNVEIVEKVIDKKVINQGKHFSGNRNDAFFVTDLCTVRPIPNTETVFARSNRNACALTKNICEDRGRFLVLMSEDGEPSPVFINTSDARWNEVKEMTGVGNNGMWRINKAFLDQQIAAGKTFVLANNPATDGGFFFAKEIAYLTKKGISYAVLQ